ncbi:MULTISPECIES: DUF3806 domain-containing protein [Microbacterium]|uniref:DUF3806 domain-containing protein n=1 Tax=Microbacterium TaxID=33882 RepID=UPI00278A0B53|nr:MULTISPECIES: DUF3806 domain-containing protein [Microbacterium]MDQ1077085.1 hypothetical protein [Microbacterium sp. SORGH_AS_0969]MDQ1117327.1 hypothetical protein [Microbacterium testaceum]
MASKGFRGLFGGARPEGQQASPPVGSPVPPTAPAEGPISGPLSADLAAEMDARREWVWTSVSADAPLDRSDNHTALSVIAALVAEVRPDETWKLQSLGTVFGDVLARVTGAEWVQVDDEFGSDAALRFGGPDDLAFPMTMISKRMEAGEDVDVLELFRSVATAIGEAQAQ